MTKLLKVTMIMALFIIMSLGVANAATVKTIDAVQSLGMPFVNPGGLGDALVNQYYYAKDVHLTYFTVVNTDEVNGARARLRFYEGRGSNEVLDFDICLSKADKFTAVIKKATTGEMQVCRIDDQSRILDADTPWVIGSGAPCVNAKFGSNNTNTAITAERYSRRVFCSFC